MSDESDVSKVAQAMLQMADGFGPIFDAGKGIRVRLEAEGWSPTVAEQLAAEIVLGAIRLAMAGAGKRK